MRNYMAGFINSNIARSWRSAFIIGLTAVGSQKYCYDLCATIYRGRLPAFAPLGKKRECHREPPGAHLSDSSAWLQRNLMPKFTYLQKDLNALSIFNVIEIGSPCEHYWFLCTFLGKEKGNEWPCYGFCYWFPCLLLFLSLLLCERKIFNKYNHWMNVSPCEVSQRVQRGLVRKCMTASPYTYGYYYWFDCLLSIITRWIYA